MRNLFIKYGYMILGTLLFALAVNLFLIPSKIVTGGLSGIATIIYYATGVLPGVVTAVGNVILGIIAWIKLGREFVLNSMFGIISITVFISLTEFLPPVTDDLLLCSVFGGIILGTGIGMTFVHGGTTGGTDIISRISQKHRPDLSIGVIMTVIDLVIIGLSLIFFKDIKLSMYGIISLVVSTAVIDGIIAHLNKGVLVFIVTKDAEKMKKAIIDYVGRGVTVIDAYGGYSNEEKKILLCVMKKNDMENLKRITEINEKNAFMIVTPSTEVFGEGFRYYR